MNKYYFYSILLFFYIPDLSLKAQGIVSADTCIIPSVITPNDDGLYDEFRIPCLANDNPDSELFIFNEWGDRILFASPYKNNWQGTYKNQPLPDGTYFYIFKKSKAAAVQRGYIVVFR